MRAQDHATEPCEEAEKDCERDSLLLPPQVLLSLLCSGALVRRGIRGTRDGLRRS